MSTPEPILFPLDDLFVALESRGFYLGADTHVRLREYLDWFLQHTGRNPRTLKYQLAALLCHDAAGQEQFYALFDQHLAPFLSGIKEKKPGESGEKRRAGTTAGTPEQEKEQPESAPAGAGARSTQPVLTEGKSGPVRVELKFPTSDLRIWNLAEMDQAVRPLREKEWATVLEWDIPATIRSTIRAGGMPTFELRRRKRAPQYLMLIDQRGPRDHLAGLYAELAAELNRRDVDTVHYFYDRSPRRCWKDRRDYSTYTTIEYLQGEFPGSRLLLVGEPEGLLDLPQLRPSNLAADLLDAWPNTALLCTRPTAEWGNAELALCQLMPVVPANAAGLAALTGQWAAVSVHPPAYWKIQSPEAAMPPVRVTRPQDAEKVLENLRYYLGREGYFWLCAAALYPELYYELTALLHDESIPPPPGLPPGDWDMNRVWWTHLLRLSRLDWFRRGSIPLPAREQLRQFFDNRVSPEQRQKVWEQLARLLEFTDAPPGSFAADSLQVTLDWYHTERQTADPLLTETARQHLWADFRSRAQTAALNDPLARRIILQPEPARQPPILFSGKTTPDALNVRSGPSASSAIIDKLPAATPVSVFEVSSDNAWYRVGENRWVNAGYVETTKQAPSPPAAAFRILWVDDNPDNNRQERALLQERFGVSITIATNTEDALSRLSGQTFDLVVSDAVRGDDYEAGMKLLNAIRARDREMPFLVYTSVTNFEYYKKIFVEAGATAVAKGTRELLEFVEKRVQPSPPASEPVKQQAAKKTKQQSRKSLRIFMIGNRADEALQDELTAWLKPLEQAYQFKLLEETSTDSPYQWYAFNRKNIEAADVLLFLFSSDLILTMRQMDLDPVLTRASQGNALLIPVILQECPWENTKLSRFQAANREPIGTAANRTDAFYEVCWQIIMAIGRFKGVVEQPTAPGAQTTSPETRFETKLRERLEKIRWDRQKITAEEPVIGEEAETEPAAETEPPVSEQEENAPPVQSAANPQQRQEKPSEPPVIKEQIQQMIAEGRTDEALAILAQYSEDAVLLQARFNNGKKQFNGGLIDFSEWQRTQAQVNYAALELVTKIPNTAKAEPVSQSADEASKTSAPKFPDSPKVYISYNHGDTTAVQQILAYLEQNRVNVIIDSEHLAPGENIAGFIAKSVRESDFVLSVVSKKSLQSAWVSVDYEQIFKNERETGRNKWIPCMLDTSLYDPDFLREALENAEERMKDLNDKAEQISAKGGDSRAFANDLERMQNHRKRLPEVIERLRSVRIADISGDRFKSGMEQVLRRIRQGGGGTYKA